MVKSSPQTEKAFQRLQLPISLVTHIPALRRNERLKVTRAAARTLRISLANSRGTARCPGTALRSVASARPPRVPCGERPLRLLPPHPHPRRGRWRPLGGCGRAERRGAAPGDPAAPQGPRPGRALTPRRGSGAGGLPTWDASGSLGSPSTPGVPLIPQHRWQPTALPGSHSPPLGFCQFHSPRGVPQHPGVPLILQHLWNPTICLVYCSSHSTLGFLLIPQHPWDLLASSGSSYLHVSSYNCDHCVKASCCGWGSVRTEIPVEQVVQEKHTISWLPVGSLVMGHGSDRCRASETPAKQQQSPKRKHNHKQIGTKVPALRSQ